ncbi:tyrosine-type recombinase/integrase [Paenibacillus alginolyticus]|uniref:Tyrosine-type recombinase/integrase n=1 Tax=Paenibacillus alginolyticus TaxID=59839 RepID=A0ABT4GHA9_9BACL|nr:tyrosine-type recombinase/integrase [Paenibacillus alginolyticus]MCY9664511.1 tyrosine-type recombinase/integrase [Paenibacillus alginolyticus]MCY9695581.1 tyrosine-type recombinase/integrase [Paenibacillus alginolyticus]MEC0148237.1 tyrosine-type recombinase/integrase [Paenibacillus alginolyticus]
MQVVQPIREQEKIEQIQAVLKEQSIRDWLLFTIGINSGLHLSDLLCLKVSDVKDRSVVSIKEEKTGKAKTFQLSPQLKAYIEEYIQYMDIDAYLFPSQRTGNPIKRIRVYRILNEAAKQVGLNDIGTHTLRKTYGYHYYLRTKNVSVLRDLFNQSAPSVTLKYIGVRE